MESILIVDTSAQWLFLSCLEPGKLCKVFYELPAVVLKEGEFLFSNSIPEDKYG